MLLRGVRRLRRLPLRNDSNNWLNRPSLVSQMIHSNSYFKILATTPAPTVRPPSRMAKRSFSSIAIGTISSTYTEILSPGITISVPAGSFTIPVTSVVRK